jgi:transcriptional regulator with XRE-family HTH domain
MGFSVSKEGSTVPEKSSTFFAERLRSLREAAGLSQYALAKRSQLSKQALSNLEMGNREPTWNTVQRISAALGVDCRSFADPALASPADPTPPRGRGRPSKGPAETTAPKKIRRKKK